MKYWTRIFLNGLPISLLFSLTCFLIYIIAQQVYRLSANDPQYQLAQELGNGLERGIEPQNLTKNLPNVDLENTISPFHIIINKEGKILCTNATLSGLYPVLPSGMIQHAWEVKEEAITWQPKPGIREAAVLLVAGKDKNYLVIAGKSLKRVAERIDVLGKQVLLGWMVSLFLYYLVLGIIESNYIQKRIPRT